MGCITSSESKKKGEASNTKKVEEIPVEKAEQKRAEKVEKIEKHESCLLYTSPSPRDQRGSRMPSSA